MLEIKTHNAKSCGTLKRQGVQKSKPRHWAQMQTYMGMAQLKRALYFAVNKDTDEHATIECDEVVAALGFIADLGPLQTWGLEVAKRHIVVDSHMATSVPGVFAAGDVVEYPGKVRLISTGFGEAATAVNNAAPVIDPTAKVFPGHSSDPKH